MLMTNNALSEISWIYFRSIVYFSLRENILYYLFMYLRRSGGETGVRIRIRLNMLAFNELHNGTLRKIVVGRREKLRIA